jgi:metallo-beta-lactamase family protein
MTLPVEVHACTDVHPLPDGEVRLLGAVHTVTGAMTRIEMGGKRLLVDCGIGQGREARDWQFPDAARDVDAVILTHGHLDHIGSLPILLDSDFDRQILATRATLDITRISLEDALELQRASRREIEWFLKRFDSLARSVPYDHLGTQVPGLGLHFTFREAGHILGSASIDVWSEQSRVIVSGDLGRPNSPILKDAFTKWPDTRPVDLVVMESTYGSRDHQHDHSHIEEKLKSVVKDVWDKKGKLFIPAFAIGRTQVLLWFLNDLVERKLIPRIPVALDTPMGLLVTETYQKFKRLYDRETIERLQRGDDPLDFDNLFVVKKGRDSWRLTEAPGPLIVIAGAGMVTGGRIVRHLIAGMPDPRNTLLFVGHQARGTPGRRIQEAADRGENFWLDGEEVRIRARIETLRGLSAHADRGELEAWLSHIPNVKRVGLHHGEVTAQNDLVTYLAKGKDAADAAHAAAEAAAAAGDDHAGHAHGDDVGNVGQD